MRPDFLLFAPLFANMNPSSSPPATPSSLTDRAKQMNERVGKPFTDDEVGTILSSIQKLFPEEYDLSALPQVLREIGHISHKADWQVTRQNAHTLASATGLWPQHPEWELSQKQFMRRVLRDGNWEGAKKHRSKLPDDSKPWVVLVTGVNGIRKTTSIYQPWFSQLLHEAICVPSDTDKPSEEVLPCGTNSFFRQLDHMIATLCNEEFATLYSLTRDDLTDDGSKKPSADSVQRYSDLKAAIFSRYRTLSELLGILLLESSINESINCMVETSGRDVAMYEYINFLFDDTNYRKLVLNFEISDLGLAKGSVDTRMVREIENGVTAGDDVHAVIDVNAGGPYGSEVLEGVERDAKAVWKKVTSDGSLDNWYKASIFINANPERPWTAQAKRPDNSLGTSFEFL